MTAPRSSRPSLRAAALALALGGCLSLPAPKGEPTTLYALEATVPPRPGAAAGPAILVAPPRARPGFDGPGMVYVPRPHELASFARHQWVDAPARMLAPLLVQALERRGGFRSVTQAPSGVEAPLRLDTEIVRLEQDFTSRPSRVRFALRAQLVDVASRRVLATRELEAVVQAPSDDPYGGVAAANGAVQRVLEEVADFCAGAAGGG